MEVSETKIETINEYQKSQTIRLVDVFVIAPILIYGGIKYRKVLPIWLSTSLITIGVFTAVYNGNNYLVNKNKNNKT